MEVPAVAHPYLWGAIIAMVALNVLLAMMIARGRRAAREVAS